MLPGLVRFPVLGTGNKTLAQAITDAGLTANSKLVLDAGDSASYSGAGQSWLDRSGGGYDFFRGATSGAEASDPTFTGSSGDLTSATYWSFDGGDYFTYDTTNEAWMQTLHKDGAVISAIAAVYLPNLVASAGLWGTSGNSPGPGSRMYFTDSEQLSYQVGKGSDPDVLVKSTDAGISTGAWHIVGLSVNENGGNVSFFYVDGAYKQTGASNTFDAAYTNPSAANAAYTMQIAAMGNNEKMFESGARLGFLGIWQGTALSKANFDTLYADLKGRYGLS